MMTNLLGDIKEFFEHNSRPVSVEEFFTFWNSLSLSEKRYYRTVSLV